MISSKLIILSSFSYTGQLVSPKEERIRGALKYKWLAGHSTGPQGHLSVTLPSGSVVKMVAPSESAKRQAEAERKGKIETANFADAVKRAKSEAEH